MNEDWKTPLGVLIIAMGFLLAGFVLFLPDLAKMRTGGLAITAGCVVVGLALIGLQRWCK